MTLHVFDDLEQGSDEWLAARRGIVTASVVGRLITPATRKVASNDVSRATVLTLAAERITGWTDPVFVSDDMMRGTLDEPLARDLYSDHFAPAVEVGFMVEDRWGFPIGFSPDGLVGDDGLIEVKSRRPKKHLQTILADQVPAENMAQIQCGLLVSGRDWCDYISYCGGMPLWVKRVHPDPKWQDAIVCAATEFERAVTEITSTYTARVAGLPMTERNTYEGIVI
jgi:hypothetical protein